MSWRSRTEVRQPTINNGQRIRRTCLACMVEPIRSENSVRGIRDAYRRGRTSDIVSLDNYFEMQDSSAHKIQTFVKTKVD